MHNGNSIKLLAGNSHLELANLMAEHLGVHLSPCEVKRFSNGEINVKIGQSVRDEDVFIVQSGCFDVNENLMELLIMISACRTASARRITAVVPCYPYARQDKKDKSRAPITAKLVANMLVTSGCDHLITMDLHAGQIQGFFDIPVDNLYSEPLMIKYIKSSIEGWQDAIIVSPDAGGAKRVTNMADRLGLDFALIHRKRVPHGARGSISNTPNGHPHISYSIPTSRSGSLGHSRRNSPDMPSLQMSEYFPIHNAIKVLHLNGFGGGPGSTTEEEDQESMELLVGNVKGKTCILVDDMIDTGVTLALATNLLNEAGAAKIIVLVSHGLFAETHIPALMSLPKVERLVVTNTIPQQTNQKAALAAKSVNENPGSEESNPDKTASNGNTDADTSSFVGNGSEERSRFEIIDVSRTFAESIRRSHNGESFDIFFGDGPWGDGNKDKERTIG